MAELSLLSTPKTSEKSQASPRGSKAVQRESTLKDSPKLPKLSVSWTGRRKDQQPTLPTQYQPQPNPPTTQPQVLRQPVATPKSLPTQQSAPSVFQASPGRKNTGQNVPLGFQQPQPPQQTPAPLIRALSVQSIPEGFPPSPPPIGSNFKFLEK